MLEAAKTGKVEKSTWFGYEIGALDARLMHF